MRAPLPPGPARERFDRSVLQSALDGRHLPPYVPGEPSEVGAAAGAGLVVPLVLDALQDAHGVRAWTPDAFEGVFVDKALRAWHGHLDVERRPRTLVTRSVTCPVLAQARQDARVCQMCRALHTMAAQKAYGERLHGLTFPRLIARGDPVCEMHVALGETES